MAKAQSTVRTTLLVAALWLPAGCIDWASLTPPADGGGGPSLCGRGGFLRCESFEGPAVNEVAWKLEKVHCSMAIDSGRKLRGATALHLHLDEVTEAAWPACLLTWWWPSPPPATFYIRAFYFFTAAPQGGQAMFIAYNNVAPGGYELDNVDGAPFSNAYLGAPWGGRASGAVKYPLGRWVCAELGVVTRTADADLHLFVDGAEVTDAAAMGVGFKPSIDSVAVGYGSHVKLPVQPATDVWIDEVAIAEQPIGCAR